MDAAQMSVTANASMGAQLFQVAILKKAADQQGAMTLDLLKTMAPPAPGKIDVYA